MLTMQEIFNKAYLGLQSQGFVISQTGGSCQYRTDSGLKCAVGWLIPDEKYNNKWESMTPYGGLYDETEFWSAIDVEKSMCSFLGELQRAHDMSVDPENMKFKLELVAKKNELEIPNAA